MIVVQVVAVGVFLIVCAVLFSLLVVAAIFTVVDTLNFLLLPKDERFSLWRMVASDFRKRWDL